MNSRALLEEIFLDALRRCNPADRCATLLEPRDGDKGFAVPKARFDVKLAEPGKLWLFGAGKAARGMAEGVAAKLGHQLKGGVVIVPAEPGEDTGVSNMRSAPAVELHEGTHPDPSEKSRAATEALLAAAERCKPDEHAIFVLSGGASALLTAPVDGLTVDEKARLGRELMAAGAPIAELNVVRKHLSLVKGGQLAARFKCGVTVLVLSDVAGNFLDTIGSGPFEHDPSTREAALSILERRLGAPKLPRALRALLRETPKEPAAHVRHVLVASGLDLARATVEAARDRGLGMAVVDSLAIEDSVEDLALGYQRRIRVGGTRGTELIVRYGEPVVRMKVPPASVARGGRSLQLALHVAELVRGEGRWTLLAAGSDGVDGSSGAAGAVVDGETWAEITAAGLDPAQNLARFDAEPALNAAGALICTGPTGNNLQDIHMLLLNGLK